MKTTLIFIRHGATESNRQGRYVGRTEECLSEEGIGEVCRKIGEGCYPPAELVAGSSMKRCVQTAELIYGMPAFLSDKWKEIDFGLWEGKTYEELKEDLDYGSWIESGGRNPFPGGESREGFIARCLEGFDDFCRIINGCTHTPKSAAMIVHGGTIMAILSTYFQEDYYAFQCRNGEGYQCELETGNERILSKIKKLGTDPEV